MPKKKKESIQPELNIGLVGHVDHGKTTLTERLSGKWTDTHSEELKRGITIRLGYADTVFRYCKKCKLYTVEETCPKCKEKSEIIRKASFVDAPGHESLMATMLAGSTIIDGAILLISANEECPQPQTREHLMALEIAGIENVVVVQNKIDLVTREEAVKNYEKIKEFLATTKYKNAPIVPISARSGANLDVLIGAIEEFIPTPKRDPKKEPIMFIARSFDINKPGTPVKNLVGGILGGAVKQGILKEGDEIEIKPGRMIAQKNKFVWIPIKTKITGLKSGGEAVKEIAPGGSVGVMTSLDPSLVKSDSLTGSVVGHPDKLPKVWYQLKLKVKLLERIVGLKEDLEVKPIAKGELLMLNVNSTATVGIVTEMKKGIVHTTLKKPICSDTGNRVTISRKAGGRFRLIGYGELVE